MFVRDIMSKNIISIEPDEHISQALSKMEKHKIHQLPVMSKGSFYGMLELKKIVSRDLENTAKAANFATNVPSIDADASIESAAQLLLTSAARALPVTKAGQIVGVISETDTMKVAKQFVKGLNQKVTDIMTQAECIGKTENYGRIKRLLFGKNISRVPIVDGDRVLGVVSTFEMIRILKGKETMEVRGGTQEKGTKEKLRLEETPVASFMRTATVMDGSKTVSDAIDLLCVNEEVIVKSDGTIGMITPKDILELFATGSKKQVYAQITGMHDESIEFKVKMDQAVTEFISKIGKISRNIEYLVVHVERMHKQGSKQKYSIRARFKSEFGFFVAHSWGWKPLDVIQEVFRNLEREVISRHGKLDTRARERRRKQR